MTVSSSSTKVKFSKWGPASSPTNNTTKACLRFNGSNHEPFRQNQKRYRGKPRLEVYLSPRLRRHAAQPRHDGYLQRVSASPSRQSAAPCGAHEVYLVHGRANVPNVLDHRDHGYLSDVLLSSRGGVRLRGHEVSR